MPIGSPIMRAFFLIQSAALLNVDEILNEGRRNRRVSVLSIIILIQRNIRMYWVYECCIVLLILVYLCEWPISRDISYTLNIQLFFFLFDIFFSLFEKKSIRSSINNFRAFRFAWSRFVFSFSLIFVFWKYFDKIHANWECLIIAL